jgi:hypothetical protein
MASLSAICSERLLAVAGIEWTKWHNCKQHGHVVLDCPMKVLLRQKDTVSRDCVITILSGALQLGRSLSRQSLGSINVA